MNFADVKASASGQWVGILHALSPVLEPALQRPGHHVPCPIHGGTDGFRLFKDVAHTGGGICNTCGSYADGFSLIGWANDWSNRDTLQAVAGYLGMQGGQSDPVRREPAPQPVIDTTKMQRRLRAIWSESFSIESNVSEPLRKYLKSRGLGAILDDPPRDVRLHPSLGFWFCDRDQRFRKLATLPAMITLVRNNEGRVRGVHRTYLQPDGSGKALVENPGRPGFPLPAKKLMALYDGATNGCAAQLYPVTMRELAVAEGIETALAVRLATGIPVWSAISAGGMSRMDVSGVDSLLVFGDRDEKGAGQKAARELSGRVVRDGAKSRILLPDHIGVDWLDVFCDRRSHEQG